MTDILHYIAGPTERKLTAAPSGAVRELLPSAIDAAAIMRALLLLGSLRVARAYNGYAVGPDALSYEAAVAYCDGLGGELPSIHSDAENEAARRMRRQRVLAWTPAVGGRRGHARVRAGVVLAGRLCRQS